nr:MFS transporter [Candidatus Dependentiae bacterium]
NYDNVKKLEAKIDTEKNLKNSIRDGMAYSVMSGIAENFFSPFAVFCEFSSQQIGTIMSLPSSIGNTFQIFTSGILSSSSYRKYWILFGAGLQGIVLFPIGIFVLFYGKIDFIFFLSLIILYQISGNSIGPLWNSFMGDIVPPSKRGTYFGLRNSINGFVACISIAAGGMILYFFKSNKLEHLGFGLLFGTGFLARMFSVIFLNKMTDPAYIKGQEKINRNSNFIKLIKNPENKNYLNFLVFLAFTNLSVFVAGPYFAVHMLKQLHYNYIEFTAASMVIIISQFLTMRWWGKWSDRYGNRNLIILTGIGVIVSPVLWIVSGSLAWIILIQIFAGIVWAGFNLCSANYIYDTLTPEDRTLGFSLNQFCNGIAIFTGATIGGYIAKHLEMESGKFIVGWFGGIYTFFPLFVISGFLRFFTLIFFYKRFTEMRQINQTDPHLLIFLFSKIRPIFGLTFELVTGYWKNIKTK